MLLHRKMAGREPAIFLLVESANTQRVVNRLKAARPHCAARDPDRSESIGVSCAKCADAGQAGPLPSATRAVIAACPIQSAAFVVAIIALTFPALGGEAVAIAPTSTPHESTQYCIPQFDELPGTTRVYC